MDTDDSCIRVVVVEAQPATAAGVSQFLIGAGCDVVAVIDDITSLDGAVESFGPDVVVFDPAAGEPHDEHTQISTIVEAVGAPLLAFASDVSSPAVHRLLEAGVMGIVPRTASAADLVEGVRAVATGAQYLHPHVVTAWLQGVQATSRSLTGIDLSTRERHVLELIAGGSTNATIAAQLNVSVSTVKSDIEQLLTKLAASDRAHAVSIAMRRGLIS